MPVIPAARTWTIVPNQTYTSTDMNDQFQEGVFAWKKLCVDAGWTVEKSSDGVIADDTDNWGTSADIGFGLQGNGAWIVLRSPAGWLTNGGFVEQLFFVDDTIGTPQVAEHKFCVFGYRDGDANGNGVASLPIANGVETTVLGGHSIVPWASDGTTGRLTTWRSTRGDVMLFVKEEAVDDINHVWMLSSNTDADGGGSGGQRWFMLGNSQLGGVFLGYGWTLSFKGIMPGGSTLTTIDAQCLLEAVTFTNTDPADNGKDLNGNIMAAPIQIWNDSGDDGRYWGTWPDAYGAPINAGRTATSWNEGDDDEATASQDPRRVLVGAMWVYMPDADFPNPFD